MIGATGSKLQKTRTAEDIKTDSEFDANEGQPLVKTQSAKAIISIQPIGARNIMVSIVLHFRCFCILTTQHRLTAKFTRGLT
jgi:hypothetical protein